MTDPIYRLSSDSLMDVAYQYSKDFQFDHSMIYLEQLIENNIDITSKELDCYYSQVILDVQEYTSNIIIGHQDTYFEENYILPIIQDCSSKYPLLNSLNLKTTFYRPNIAHMLRMDHSSKYEYILKYVTLHLLNKKKMDHPEYYLVTLILCNIVLLFAKGVLVQANESDCGQWLTQFDQDIKRQPITGDGILALYDMKNAICHGRVFIQENTITFHNTRDNKSQVFSMSFQDLINSYLYIASKLSKHIKKYKEIFVDTWESVFGILLGKPFYNGGMGGLIGILDFMMMYQKIDNFANMIGTPFKRNNPNQLDPIIEISTKKGFSVRHIRNMFSHEFTFDKKEGKVVIKFKEKGKQRSKIFRVGPVEWLYMSDMMRLMLYPLYMSAMVHSPK